MSLMDYLRRLFGKKKKAPVAAPVQPPVMQATFYDDFKTLENWIVSTWTAPQAHSINHAGKFAAENVTLGAGGLCLKLSQKIVNSKIISTGAEVTSKQSFGYGTYEFVMKASADAKNQPVSGSITGCFNYLDGSETEIDCEVEGGDRCHLTQFTSWIGETKPSQSLQVTTGAATPESKYFLYKFVWSPGQILFYRDDVLVATFKNVVPTQPAPFMFNHWGTNDPNWGGVATPGVDRFMYVKRFTFTEL